jgi:hypothetical protein
VEASPFSNFARLVFPAIREQDLKQLELSFEEEKEAWRRHHIESLLESASLPFRKKIQMLEEMEEVARAVAAATSPVARRARRAHDALAPKAPAQPARRGGGKPSEFGVEFGSARLQDRPAAHARRAANCVNWLGRLALSIRFATPSASVRSKELPASGGLGGIIHARCTLLAQVGKWSNDFASC